MVTLTIGDPIPWFIIPSTSNPNYHFDTVGGYRTVLFFFGSTKAQNVRAIVQDFCNLQSQFAAVGVPFFGVSVDPADQELADVIEEPTFCKFLWDFDRSVSQSFGVCQSTNPGETQYSPTAFVLDENLHVLQVFPVTQAEGYAEQVLHYVSNLPAVAPAVAAARQAPVLFIPRVLDPEFCQSLIQLYERDGGRDSGFMREVDGKTVEILDHSFKKRRDLNLAEDPTMLNTLNQIMLRRIKPEIEKAFQFSISRFERYIVSCYEATNQGFFNRHRDNTTKGTVHRRFAMTLNLNTGEYEGGCLRFPEYGTQLYRPEVGEAVIFSCSLLHEATPVTQGRRFALLSFFYNDEDAQIRTQNQKYLATASSESSKPATEKPKSVAKATGFQPKSSRKRR